MRSAQKTRIGTLVVFASATLAGVANAQAQSRDETVSISDPRPLAKTAETLIKRYGVPVSYEDVSAYTYEGDFSESREVQTTHWGARVLAPRGGSITLTLPKANLPAVPLTTATVEGFLGTAAAQHQAAGNPGRFQILETLAGPAIVPVANRDSSGVLIQDRSLLDFRVTFPEMDRDIESALETFAQALHTATGKTINVRHGHPSMAVRIGANDEVARDVLAKMITSLRRTPGLGTASSRRNPRATCEIHLDTYFRAISRLAPRSGLLTIS